MKTAYFDCFSGISGDMFIGALIDLGLDVNFLKKELGKLNLKGYNIESKKILKNGISATKFDVVENPKNYHEELNLKEINKIIGNSKFDNETKNTIKKIFLKIAVAEAKIHNKPIEKVHFHEIGAMDTIIDVAGAVLGLKKLGIGKIYCSKLNTGTGFVEFSHGRFPVPAPATAEILRGVPIYHNNVEAELVTPTGAAIIKALAEKFCEMPAMKVEKIGYGAGTKDLEQPNVLRVFLGKNDKTENETTNIIETNIDNMNPEIYPYVIDKLMENGALDAYLTNIIMKKGRPAVKLTVLSEIKDTDKLCNIIFDETTTLGIRIFRAERKILQREIKTIKTRYGDVRLKISKLNNEIKNIMPEYGDCVKIAKKHKIPLKKVYEEMKEKINYFNHEVQTHY
ncbi:nickel pincer cofactor biosynthesis protein LarC [Candidatus Woesearchaeota archaeon]|nr:nickel pincer cofactor biosynthesis protein LarC [Candidatus Woesearchaeota archaeon]